MPARRGCASAPAVRSTRWPGVLGHCVAVLVAVDVVHSFANAAVSGGSHVTQAGNVLRGGPIRVLAWGLGVGAVATLSQRRTDVGIILGGSAALMIAVSSGVA